MSEDLERVYTINLGKVLLSQSQHRAVRAINMIKEFARHHMKVQDIKIEEELAKLVWARGVRRPPRKVRVRMNLTDEGQILVSAYDQELEDRLHPEDSKKPSETVSEPSAVAPEPAAPTETVSESSDTTNSVDESETREASDRS